VPRQLAACPSLKAVGLKSCGIKLFPEHALPASIEWLMLTDNPIETLPDSIGELVNLRKCAFAGMHLSSLPDSMRNCRKIELIRLSANRFETPPPDWLLELPKLTWYSDGGNPFSRAGATEELPVHAWGRYELKDKPGDRPLNESPSSFVYRAIDRETDEEVAIKKFKKGLTSDGYPEDDLATAVTAGNHPQLIPLRARLQNPDGLVTTLLSHDRFFKLGLPPDLATVTRDTFKPDTSYSSAFIVRTLVGVAEACRHLHDRGVVHGDLYAHNILATKTGHGVVTDFGAASLYDPSRRELFERIDARAFGCLIEDLLSCCSEQGNPRVAELREIQQACMSDDIGQRPGFEHLEARLKALTRPERGGNSWVKA
jgi:hypothetical protein